MLQFRRLRNRIYRSRRIRLSLEDEVKVSKDQMEVAKEKIRRLEETVEQMKQRIKDLEDLHA